MRSNHVLSKRDRLGLCAALLLYHRATVQCRLFVYVTSPNLFQAKLCDSFICHNMADSIGSILYPYEQGLWRKFNGYELEQLHRKFWIQGESRNILLNPRETEDEGDDDDIGPNCHVLDIGLPTLGLTKLWIRNEYVRMYKHCEDHLETNRNESKSPAVVVTGQPGIGKRFTLSSFSVINYTG